MSRVPNSTIVLVRPERDMAVVKIGIKLYFKTASHCTLSQSHSETVSTNCVDCCAVVLLCLTALRKRDAFGFVSNIVCHIAGTGSPNSGGDIRDANYVDPRTEMYNRNRAQLYHEL